jgi:hypothetical protein
VVGREHDLDRSRSSLPDPVTWIAAGPRADEHTHGPTEHHPVERSIEASDQSARDEDDPSGEEEIPDATHSPNVRPPMSQAAGRAVLIASRCEGRVATFRRCV